MNNFFGFKINQSRVYSKNGKRLAVTKVKAEPLTVIGFCNKEKDNYQALRVGIGLVKRLNKPIAGQVKKLKIKPKFIREIKVEKLNDEIKLGSQILVRDVFAVGDKIKVSGITKGKGFAGGVKRWGFAGGPRTHGQSDRQRAPGSIGQGTTPGRVRKGKKMAGHMGAKIKTIGNLQVIKIKDQEIWLKGLVPGHKDGLVELTKVKTGEFSGLWGEITEKKDKEIDKTDKSKDKKIDEKSKN